jgi:uncharacterized sporulation protein YeaH/YhbH (DUF444 family)
MDWALVNKGMNFRVPQKAANGFLHFLNQMRQRASCMKYEMNEKISVWHNLLFLYQKYTESNDMFRLAHITKSSDLATAIRTKFHRSGMADV